jgi:hypothetical protein
MTDREMLERQVQELFRDLPLPESDREAVLAQAARVLASVRTLDELPLNAVEPAGIYQVIP